VSDEIVNVEQGWSPAGKEAWHTTNQRMRLLPLSGRRASTRFGLGNRWDDDQGFSSQAAIHRDCPDPGKKTLVNENKPGTIARRCAQAPLMPEGKIIMTQANLRLVEGTFVDKTKALDAALSQIERAFGKGSIMRLGKNQKAVEIDTVPTGSLGLDIALGVGGLPRGRVVEIYGPESSGKTTLTLHVIAEAQKKGGVCAFIDAEHALDTIYARKLGINLEDLLISQPDTGEQALEITDTLVRSGAVDVLVIDSVAALTPRAEIEGEMGDSQPGLQARLMSQALRKLTASISRSQTTVIFINQIRMKIGVMYGSPETTTGGNALKFYASVRLDIRRIGSIKDHDEVTGNQTRVKVVKNKLAPPFKQVEFDIMYGEGISKTGELIDLGVKAGVVEKSGAWFSYDSQRLGQGRENAKNFLKANPQIAERIEQDIRENSGLIADRLLDQSGMSGPAEETGG
jgi:recombination protein RecA